MILYHKQTVPFNQSDFFLPAFNAIIVDEKVGFCNFKSFLVLENDLLEETDAGFVAGEKV